MSLHSYTPNVTEYLAHRWAHVLDPNAPMPELLWDWRHMFPRLNHDWVWVVEKGLETEAVLVAAPCHGLVMLQRLKTSQNSPHSVLVMLFRRAFQDMEKRGYSRFFAVLDPKVEAENHLLTIIRVAGGVVRTSPHVFAFGETKIGEEY